MHVSKLAVIAINQNFSASFYFVCLQRIKLTFQDVDIEVADMCMRDAIELVEVVNNQARGLGVFCGNQTYPPVVSSTNVIIIMFRSDFMVGRRGFHIRYQISGMPCTYIIP